MIAMPTNQPDIGSKVTIKGSSGIVVGTEQVDRGDSLRRPAGRNLLVRFEDGSDKWCAHADST